MNNEVTVQLAPAVPPGSVPVTAQFRAWIHAALAGRARGAVTVRIVDEPESADLNGAWRGKPYATNVLSFPLGEAPDARFQSGLLGDLVICAPVVAREAAEQRKPEPAHWAHMVVHGTLHLLGYDHEIEADATRMEALEIRILQHLGYPNPYLQMDVDERRPT